MKVLKSSLARHVFADLASQGQLSSFVASSSLAEKHAQASSKTFKIIVHFGESTKKKVVSTKVIPRVYEEEALSA